MPDPPEWITGITTTMKTNQRWFLLLLLLLTEMKTKKTLRHLPNDYGWH